MHNLVLSPIDPEVLIRKISDQVTENILKAIRSERGPEEEQEKLLTVQEAAEFLNLKVPTIYSKVSRGELPVMKRSKRLYFSRNELMGYLKKGARKSNFAIQDEAENFLKNKAKS
ncbi:helix-turn-helix domain-containing protein [Cyclobacterium sp. SYSU L10401]|uniref:helix-turn-helix domain-containing protein n=1 Tax=Cyclobacterium sp. SYSU L10401 TaxID=2678657 RepID=UPI001F092ADA|nr:helix-turn-helix domain-containing protein [Cyclobacterium sp. SYSU L10401]